MQGKKHWLLQKFLSGHCHFWTRKVYYIKCSILSRICKFTNTIPFLVLHTSMVFLIWENTYVQIMSFWQGVKWGIYVVGMSIEKLFDMWRNDEFWNFHATYSNVFFWSTKLRQPRQCRDSCTYYIIFQNFVISSFRHIFSIDMPTT